MEASLDTLHGFGPAHRTSGALAAAPLLATCPSADCPQSASRCGSSVPFRPRHLAFSTTCDLLLSRSKDEGYSLGQPLPVHLLCVELPSPGSRKGIKLRLPATDILPFRRQQTSLFQPMKSWIQRPLLHLKDFSRDP